MSNSRYYELFQSRSFLATKIGKHLEGEEKIERLTESQKLLCLAKFHGSEKISILDIFCQEVNLLVLLLGGTFQSCFVEVKSVLVSREIKRIRLVK